MSTTVAPGTTPPCASLMVPSTVPVVIWAEAGSALRIVSAKAAIPVRALCTIATPPDLTWNVQQFGDDGRSAPALMASPRARRYRSSVHPGTFRTSAPRLSSRFGGWRVGGSDARLNRGLWIEE